MSVGQRTAVTLMFAVLGLMLPVLLGMGGGAVRLFDDPDAAVAALNRYALYVGFPALIFAGLARADAPLPTSWVFWILVPLALGLALLPLRSVGGRLGGHAGTLALVVSFGNVAYLGLPVVERVLGAQAMPTAGLVVGIYVLLSLTVGPVLLLSWSGQDGGAALGTSLRKVSRQPLFWAPILGVGSRALPAEVSGMLVEVTDPIGRSAAPVALFLLGLYLHTHAGRLRRVDGAAWAHVVAKGLWLPLVTGGLVAAALTWGHLEREAARVVILLSAMPPAITTFALAKEFGVGEERVAQVIVAGSAVSLFTLPIVSAIVLWI